MMEKPLVDKKYILQKYPGKGGWTYAAIPEILQDKHSPFGWVKVKGSIDGVEIKQYHLMPMGNGQLFLPVKASIRKQIKKQEGDTVHVILYADNSSLIIPEEFKLCLEDEPKAKHAFELLSEQEQKKKIQYIYSSKKLEVQVERIVEVIEGLKSKN